jgi:hypothetical protein
MSEQKTAPAMFAGTKPPRDSTPAPTGKQPDRAVALKSESGGVAAGRLTGFTLLPILAVGLIVLVASGHVMIALIAGAALLIVAVIAGVNRSAGKRRVATTTRVRPDGSVTTTTRPVQRRERNRRRQRTRGGLLGRRLSGDGGSSHTRSRSWIPGSNRRNSQRSALRDGSGSPSRGPGSGRRPGANQSAPSTKPRLRDRMRPGRSQRDAMRDGGAPKGPGARDPKSPPRTRGTDGRWPWSRNRSSNDGPGGRKSPGGSPRSPKIPTGKRPRGGDDNLGSPSGGSRRRNRSASDGTGGPGGQSKGKSPRDAKSSAPSALSGGRPSRVPTWVKRLTAPTDRPSHRRDPGRPKREPVLDRARRSWVTAWSDGDRKPARQKRRDRVARSAARDAAATAAPASPPSATAPESNRERNHRRLWPRSGRAKAPSQDFAARLDQRWASRGIGQRQAPRHDPVVAPKPQASSAAAAAFAEDWAPSKSHGADRSSVTSGFEAELTDWTPSKPPRPAPRPGSKGGSSGMSNESTESQAQAGTAAAYASATRSARAGSSSADGRANQLRADAARLPNTARMAVHKADLTRQAGKWVRVSAVYSAVASALSRSATANRQNGS